MKQQMTLWIALAALALGAPAGAQTTTDTTEQTTATDTETQTATEGSETNTIDEEFPVANETDGEPQAGQGYMKAQHAEWEVRCIKAAEGEDEICRLYNLLKDDEGASVAEFNLSALPSGGKAAAGVDIATPLGSLLTKQVLLKVDQGKTNRYPYTWCDQLACYARFGLTMEQIDAMKRGANTEITVWSVAAPETPIKLNMSLSGFTAAWNEVAPK